MNELPFKSPLVVGYKGEIGSHILQGLLKVVPKAKDIWCFDINESEDEKIDRIQKSDYIFLCVPINETRNWLARYQPYLKNKTIVEQTSLKMPVWNSHSLLDINLIGMHLLYRPSSTPNVADRRCILIDNVVSYHWDVTLTQMFGCRIIHVDSAEQHDEMMAKMQSLVHRVILSLSHVTNSLPNTYVGGKIQDLAYRICQGDLELYEAIQMNPHADNAAYEFLEEFNNFDIKNYIKEDKDVLFG